MKDLEDLSDNAARAINIFTLFEPTSHPISREIEATSESGQRYFNSEALREIGLGFIEIANWLDERAGVKRETPGEAVELADYGGRR